MNYDWDFSVLLQPEYLRTLLSGFWLTILLTFYSLLAGTPLGILIGTLASLGVKRGQLFEGMGRSSRPLNTLGRQALSVVRWVAIAYIDVIRAIPLLLLILIAYYGLPTIATWKVSPFQTSVIALSINLSAFLADLVRGAVAGVSRGSILAGRSLGMNSWLVWRHIILPEVLREILPGVTLLYITIFKMSTLCAVVAVYEVLHSADAIIQRTYKPLEAYLAVCILFVVVIVPLSAIARRLEATNLFRRRSS